MKKYLQKNFIVNNNELIKYGLSTVFNKASAFLVFIPYTYLLSKGDLGKYDLYLLVFNIIYPIISLQIYESVYRWVIDENRTLSSYAILFNSLMILFIASSITLIASFFLYYIRRDINELYLILFSISFIYFTTFQYYLRSIQNLNLYFWSNIISSSLNILLNVFFIYSDNITLGSIFIIQIISYVVTTLILFIIVSRDSNVSDKIKSKELIKKMLEYSFPLVPNLFFNLVMLGANKFIVLKYLGVKENGVFSIPSKFSHLFLILTIILYLPIQDKFLSNKLSKIDFNIFLKRLIYLTILSIIVFPIALYYTVSPLYQSSWIYLPVMLISVLLNILVTIQGLPYMKDKNTFSLTKSSFFGALASIVFGFLLIPTFGLNGATISQLLAFLFLFLYRYIDSYKNSYQFTNLK